jgi:hypothetical protein
MVGYLIAAGWLLAAAITEAVLDVDAEQQSLEEVAEPLRALRQATARGRVRARGHRFELVERTG